MAIIVFDYKIGNFTVKSFLYKSLKEYKCDQCNTTIKNKSLYFKELPYFKRKMSKVDFAICYRKKLILCESCGYKRYNKKFEFSNFANQESIIDFFKNVELLPKDYEIENKYLIFLYFNNFGFDIEIEKRNFSVKKFNKKTMKLIKYKNEIYSVYKSNFKYFYKKIIDNS